MKKRKITGRQLITIAIGLLLLQAPANLRAQSLGDSAIVALSSIDSVYRNAFYLGFDIKIAYKSDTLWAGTDSADFVYTEMVGNYIFNGKKALYKLGDIEYLQNETYTIALYKENKTILVGKTDTNQVVTNFLPTRQVFDTMMADLDSLYECSSIVTSDDRKIITFKSNSDSLTLFKTVEIEYDTTTFLLSKVVYVMYDNDYTAPDEILSTDVRRKISFSFNFTNYRIERVDPDVFSEMKYLFFDGPAVIKPAAPYNDFTIYKSY